jgi:hypothetical protein
MEYFAGYILIGFIVWVFGIRHEFKMGRLSILSEYLFISGIIWFAWPIWIMMAIASWREFFPKKGKE